MVPDRFAIEWLIGRLHVSTPDAQVVSEITRRLPKNTLDSTRDAMVEYALKVHHENQDLYVDVMGGMW